MNSTKDFHEQQEEISRVGQKEAGKERATTGPHATATATPL